MDTLIREKLVIDNEKDLSEYFKSGFKNNQTLGIEYEKLAVQKKNFKSVEFFFNNGILDFLTAYRKEYHNIPCYENNILLGLISNKGNITLEPGCQVEYSLTPVNTIADIENELKNYNKRTAQIANLLGFSFISGGLQPISTFNDIKVLPKNRYKFMTRYFLDKGNLAYSMMRETAGVQVSIDYSDEEDAIRKFSTALKLSPFMTALFSNSPIRNFKLSDYKSFRANAWLNTDTKRCGLVSSKLFDYNPEFTFDDYTQLLLDVPMIFHKEKYINQKTFREFLKEEGMIFLSDWKMHLSLFFTDVRLKNYIEIRNHDCQKLEYTLAIPAIYKGIMYSSDGIEQVQNLFKDFKYQDFEYVRQNAPRFGIDFSIKDINVSDILKEIFEIAKKGLKEFGLSEENYLGEIESLLNENLTPADVIIKNFKGSWNGNIQKLIEFSKIK